MEKLSKYSKKSKKSSSSKTSPQHQRLVEYSDVSSNELSAPEAGELPSDGLSIVSDDEISTIGNNNNIYEPIDDDDDELEKMMDGDQYSDTYSDNTATKKRKKQKKKSKKLKKSKKRKRRRKSSDSIEEISEDDAILDEVDNAKKIDDGFTPPLDQISYTPKRKFIDGYTPISHGSPSINASPDSPLSDGIVVVPVSSKSKRNDYRSPHTPPMPSIKSKLINDERAGHHQIASGRHSSLSSSKSLYIQSQFNAMNLNPLAFLGTSQKGTTQISSAKKANDRSSSYRKRTRSRERSPYDYSIDSGSNNRRRRERERSSPYSRGSSRKRHDRRKRSK